MSLNAAELLSVGAPHLETGSNKRIKALVCVLCVWGGGRCWLLTSLWMAYYIPGFPAIKCCGSNQSASHLLMVCSLCGTSEFGGRQTLRPTMAACSLTLMCPLAKTLAFLSSRQKVGAGVREWSRWLPSREPRTAWENSAWKAPMFPSVFALRLPGCFIREREHPRLLLAPD